MSSVQIKPEFLLTSHRDSHHLPPKTLLFHGSFERDKWITVNRYPKDWGCTLQVKLPGDMETGLRCAPVEEEIRPTALSCDSSGSKQKRSENEWNQTCSRARQLTYPEGNDIYSDHRHSHRHQTPMGVVWKPSFEPFQDELFPLPTQSAYRTKKGPRNTTGESSLKVPITHTNHFDD